jgi:hypothetical protein
MRRILIATPTYNGELDYRYHASIAKMSQEANAKGWGCDFTLRTTDSILPRARAVLFAQFLEGNFDDMMCVDSDVWAESGCFTRLMSHDVALVGGVYPHRGDKEGFVFKPWQDRLMFDEKTGLMEVEASPTGFLRIRRDCAEKLVAAHQDEWYEDMTAPGKRLFNLFEFQFNKATHQLWGEDYTFCKKWAALGEKTWIDPELILHHKWQTESVGALGPWLRTKYAREIELQKMGIEGRTLAGVKELLNGLTPPPEPQRAPV